MPPPVTLFGRLSLRQLESLAIVAPIAFLSVVYLLILGPVHPAFHSWPGFILLAGLLAAAVWLFARSVFRAVRALQEEVEALSSETAHHNQQLMLLHGTDLALMRETRVDGALRRIPELAIRLLGGCHAALLLAEPTARVDVRPPLAETPPDSCAVALTLRAGGDLGLSQPEARLLVVPVARLGTEIGTLYVARNRETTEFSPVDVELARMFATHAAMVVENDRLYDEVQVLAIEAERQALAREMHDSLAQVLAFVNTKAQAVELYLRNDDVSTARQQMAELSAAAREVYAEIREGISALRVDIGGKNLEALLSEAVRDFADSTGLETRLDWRSGDDDRDLPPAAGVHLLRIVQEALANVRRHASAKHVDIVACTVDGHLELLVADDGRGFSTSDAVGDGKPRFGLQTMSERAGAIGGTIEVDSEPDHGTRIRVRVPLDRTHRPTEP